MMKMKATALAAILALLLTAIAATSMPAAADETKETDDDHVDIVSPDDGAEVAGRVTFTVEVWACFCDGKTSLYIDDEFISEGENQGSETRGDEVIEIFTHEWDSTAVGDGEHLVVAYGKHGEGYDKMSIVVDNDPADDDKAEEPAPDTTPAPPDDQLVDEPADDGGDTGSDDGDREDGETGGDGDDTVTISADDDDTVVGADVDADEGGTTTDSSSDGATDGVSEGATDTPEDGDKDDGDGTVDHQPGGDGTDPGDGDTIGIDDGLPGGESPEKEANSADGDDTKDSEEEGITYMLGLVLVAASIVILLVVLVRRGE